MSTVRDAFDSLRQPEYTGENRCVPCTVANVVIAVVVAAAAWLLLAPAAGVAVLLASLAAIALRGYLVPGTPTLTKRYFPDRVLALFDKRPAAEADPVSEVDPAEELFAAGAIVECDGDDFCIEESVREAWLARADDVDGDDELAAAAAEYFDADEAAISFEPLGPSFTVLVDGSEWGEYPSRAAFLAEVTGARVLADRLDDWEAFTLSAQSEILAAFRLFLDICPACGGPATIGEETVESCCRDISIVAVGCEDCDSRLFEIEQFGEFDLG